jgi:hypothetical protein
VPRVRPSWFINRSRRLAGVIRATSWCAPLVGGLALVTLTGFAALARGSSLATVHPSAGSRPASTRQDFSSLPFAARAAVSRGLSAGRRRLSVHRASSGAIIVSDPTLGLHATLIAGGIAVRGAHGLRVALSGPAIGPGGTLTPVRGFASPSLTHHRVTFSSPGVAEWYANAPWGVEQGFAIAHRPIGAGPLQISQTLSGNAAARVQAGRQGVRFGAKARGPRYTRLAVTDATGAHIQASMGLSDRRLTITINDTHAVYPLRIDPDFQPWPYPADLPPAPPAYECRTPTSC